MKRLNNPSSYKIETSKNIYIVTLQRLKNTTYGNPRFDAVVVCLGSAASSGIISYYTIHFIFNGHYLSEYDEAKQLITEYEKEI